MYLMTEPQIYEASTHETFSRIDYMLGPKTSLNKLKNIEIIQGNFFNHKGIKLEINNRKKSGKCTNMWKLNNTFINIQQITEEIQEKLENTLRQANKTQQTKLRVR